MCAAASGDGEAEVICGVEADGGGGEGDGHLEAVGGQRVEAAGEDEGERTVALGDDGRVLLRRNAQRAEQEHVRGGGGDDGDGGADELGDGDVPRCDAADEEG
eukprot:5019926-Pleurochrysis_carterae.AAC.1